MVSVAITGAAGSVGRRLCRVLLESDAAERIVAIDRRAAEVHDDRISWHTRELTTSSASASDLADLFDGVDVVVHLASVPPLVEGQPGGGDVALAKMVFSAMDRSGVHRMVLLSSATVYGARQGNPVPLTEDAPVAPNPEFRYAVDKAATERLADRWRGESPERLLAILRPTTAVAEDEASDVAHALYAHAALRAGDADPPVQFIHLDDVASAAGVAVTGRLDGVFNVAPDGWIPPDELRELAGPTPRLRLPERLVTAVDAVRWRYGSAPTPPGLVPYTMYSWVVANDRLRAAGWAPDNSNEEAYVRGHRPGPLDVLSPKRRQELALGATGGALVAGLGAAAAGARILLRKR